MNQQFIREVDATVKLSKWWRERCREEILLLNGKASFIDIGSNHSLSSASLLYSVCQKDSAIRFLKLEEQRIDLAIKRMTQKCLGDDISIAFSSYIHGTYLVLLKKYLEALHAFSFAVTKFGSEVDLSPEIFNIRNICKKFIHTIQLTLECQSCRSLIQNTQLISQSPQQATRCIERVTFGSISYETFLSDYAIKKIPLIFSNAIDHMLPNSSEWSLLSLAERLGTHVVPLKSTRPESVEWAQQEDSGSMTFDQYISEIKDITCGDKYLVDYPILLHFPQLLQDFRLPIYFGADLLQAAPEGALYKDSWPSLFVGPAGSRSSLHIDSFGSNFWMLLLTGRKKWIFYPPDEAPLLYPNYDFSLDPFFQFDPLSDSPNYKDYPVAARTHPYEVVLRPGELLFVPSGSPHCVINLDDTVAISGNYVDSSNLEAARRELGVAGLLCPRAKELHVFLSGLEQSVVQRSSQALRLNRTAVIPFEEFKSCLWMNRTRSITREAEEDKEDNRDGKRLKPS